MARGIAPPLTSQQADPDLFKGLPPVDLPTIRRNPSQVQPQPPPQTPEQIRASEGRQRFREDNIIRRDKNKANLATPRTPAQPTEADELSNRIFQEVTGTPAEAASEFAGGVLESVSLGDSLLTTSPSISSGRTDDIVIESNSAKRRVEERDVVEPEVAPIRSRGQQRKDAAFLAATSPLLLPLNVGEFLFNLSQSGAPADLQLPEESLPNPVTPIREGVEKFLNIPEPVTNLDAKIIQSGGTMLATAPFFFMKPLQVLKIVKDIKSARDVARAVIPSKDAAISAARTGTAFTAAAVGGPVAEELAEQEGAGPGGKVLANVGGTLAGFGSARFGSGLLTLGGRMMARSTARGMIESRKLIRKTFEEAEALQKVFPSIRMNIGDISPGARAMRTQARRSNANFNFNELQRVRQNIQNAENEFRLIVPFHTAEEAGEKIRSAFVAAKRSIGRERGAAFDKFGEVSARAVAVRANVTDDVFGNLPIEARRLLAPSAAQTQRTAAIGRATGLGLPPPQSLPQSLISLKAVRGIRTKIDESLALATKGTDRELLGRQAKALDDLVNAVVGSMDDQVASVATREALDAANAGYVDYANTFLRSPVASLGSRKKTSAQAFKLIFNDPLDAGAQNTKALLKSLKEAFGQDEAAELVRNGLSAKLHNMLAGKGRVDPDQLATFARKHELITKEFPQLNAQFGKLDQLQQIGRFVELNEKFFDPSLVVTGKRSAAVMVTALMRVVGIPFTLRERANVVKFLEGSTAKQFEGAMQKFSEDPDFMGQLINITGSGQFFGLVRKAVAAAGVSGSQAAGRTLELPTIPTTIELPPEEVTPTPTP